MFIESEILLAVLLDLASRNIPALGLHDGLMVPMSKKETAKDVMTAQARNFIGYPIPVTEKS